MSQIGSLDHNSPSHSLYGSGFSLSTITQAEYLNWVDYHWFELISSVYQARKFSMTMENCSLYSCKGVSVQALPARGRS